ncbi:CRAL-TRIO domain-containing protein [Caerostris darwini]|uniref:CRAL-TRIO domain-containing protein n=1 Tax=Caerostris darwini TaxID=1538125 RepID=A0AAV4S804_9ARAC|nr:CRAL-TRIO domain-containing protein [Caerostris darwini]
MTTSFSDAPIHIQEDELLPLELNYMPEFVLRKKEEELNGIHVDKQKCLRELKDLLDGHKLSRGIDFEDDFLQVYLMHSKYRADRAFSFIRNYLNLRKNHGYFFQKVDFDFTIIPDCQFATVLPYRCQDGSVTVLCELGKLDPDQTGLEPLKKILFMIYQQELRNPVTQVAGFNIIHDFAGTGFRHLKHCTPSLVYLLNHITVDIFPVRYSGFHLVNGNYLMNLLISLIKPLMPEQFRKIIFVHSSPEDLLNHFPRSVLPVKYGGKQTDYYAADWLKKANEQQDDFPAEGQKNIF